MNFFTRRNYKTLNLIQIKRTALLHNFDYFQKLVPFYRICPVLKSNAYGHGLKLVGKLVEREIKPEFVCVDSLYEAYELSKEGIKTPIFIMGYTFPENFRFKKIDFILPVWDIETLKFLNFYQPGARVHLKIDTGMNRLGTKEDEVENFLRELKRIRKLRLRIEGIYSHLSVADDPKGDKKTEDQILLFKKIVSFFEKNGLVFKYKHINATAGTFRFPDREFNVSRLGIGFYGISPFVKGTSEDNELKRKIRPALKLISHICQLKEVEKGESIGYGLKNKSRKRMKIGILPLGYSDGIDRRLSNKGVVLVKGKYCPVVGSVCMNMMAIDVSHLTKVKVGDEVVLFDNDNVKLNSVKEVAESLGTIPYEVLVRLSPLIRREMC